MTDIEKRAKELALSYEATKDDFGYGYHKGLEEGYIIGATKQKAIDDKRYEEYLAYMSRELTNDLSFQRKTIIDKACEWITNHNGDDSVIEEFLKTMEG